jgi:hypothetical protein
MPTTYNEHLTNAIELTSNLGASIPPFAFGEKNTLLTAENSAATIKLIRESGINSFSSAAGQCLKWSHALLPLISEGLNCPVLLTIGQLHIGDKEIYNPSAADFTRWYEKGFQESDFHDKKGFNLHCWYTLPSGEILDLTFWTTMGIVWGKSEKVGSVVGGYPDEISPHPKFIPIVVGSDYIETVERLTGSQFLSRSLNMGELSAMRMLRLR